MKNTRKVNFFDVDDIFFTIETKMERAGVIAEQLQEYFRFDSPSTAAMQEIGLYYQRISVYVGILQDTLHEIFTQLDRWDEISNAPQEKKPAPSTAPGVRHDVTLSWTEPADGDNLFTGFNRIHEKGEDPQPADKSLAQLAWIIDRIREDDIFEFGETDENLERLVGEAGIVLRRKDRPLFAAQQAGDILRGLYTSWKKQTAPEEEETTAETFNPA